MERYPPASGLMGLQKLSEGFGNVLFVERESICRLRIGVLVVRGEMQGVEN